MAATASRQPEEWQARGLSQITCLRGAYEAAHRRAPGLIGVILPAAGLVCTAKIRWVRGDLPSRPAPACPAAEDRAADRWIPSGHYGRDWSADPPTSTGRGESGTDPGTSLRPAERPCTQNKARIRRPQRSVAQFEAFEQIRLIES